MAEIDTVLAANRDAVEQLIRAGEQSGAAWNVPRAPGKWSPSQVVEHVRRSLEEGANGVAGTSSIQTSSVVLMLLRPVARLYFKRVVKTGEFPTGFKAHKMMDPVTGPATPAEARVRLEEAFANFDQACRRQAARGQPVANSVFGTVSVEDYVRFNAIHTRHHCKQMPAATELTSV